MRLLICGDRNWTDYDLISEIVDELMPDVVIEGEARGADSLARGAAEIRGIEVLKFPAQWVKYGRGAGYIRNQQMLDEGKPTHVLAFHDDIQSSKGTRNMIESARKAGLSTCVISHNSVEVVWNSPNGFR